MSWDERAEDYAVAHHTYEHLTFTDNVRHASGFVRGARWQRDQLRTDEAVERVINELHRYDYGESLDHHNAVCERDRGGCDRREIYADHARDVIRALLGEGA